VLVLVLVLALALASGASACVPAGPDEDPHGGAGAHFVPSPAANGQPFVTTDGWTVTVDRIALSAIFSAMSAPTPRQVVKGSGGDSAQGNYLVDASKEQDLVLRAFPAEHVDLNVQLWDTVATFSLGALTDPPAMHGVDSALAARFTESPDSDEPGLDGEPSISDSGPTIILAAHGAKGGRTVRFDLGFQSFSPSATGGIDLQPNTLTERTFEVRVEALFTNDAGALAFDDIDAADRDRDGQISPHELRLYEVPPCNGCTDDERENVESAASQKALSVALDNRASQLLVVK
jgi:hypothetical protein